MEGRLFGQKQLGLGRVVKGQRLLPDLTGPQNANPFPPCHGPARGHRAAQVMRAMRRQGLILGLGFSENGILAFEFNGFHG